MQTLDIPPLRLGLLYLVLLLPLWMLWRLRLRLVRDLLLSVGRMTVQLFMVGFYLQYIFRWNSILINLLWLAVMIVVANLTVLGQAGLVLKRFFWASCVGISTGTLFMIAVLVLFLIRPEPFYDARYVIPLAGMLLGNCLRGNVIVMERFYSGIRKSENEFLSYLMMGATLAEAVRPYLQEAVRAAVAPTIATMMTLGIVSLPGMMTGQILGGSVPLVAIKYQIAIMLGIFISLMVSAVMNVFLSLPAAFNDYGILREDVFRK